MANYENLKSAIQQVVKTNGNNAITGALLQQSLLAIINSLGAGYQFIGVATPATNPGTPDKRVFYIAAEPGTYTNFGGLEVTEDEVVVLIWDSSWHKAQIWATNIIRPLLDEKVDKEEGKGLSSNDYTDEEKAKLAGLENYDDTQIKALIAGKANLQHQHKVADIADFPELYYDATAFFASGAYPSDKYEELLEAVKAKRTVYATIDEEGYVSNVFFVSSANNDGSSSRVLLTTIFADGSNLYLNTFVLRQSGMTPLQESITGKANKATTLSGYGIGDAYTKSEVDAGLATKQDTLQLTVKDNGNIVLANLQGQSKEFMPATPSGDPMHWAYEAAGAEYNDTGADIIKTTPWANMVDDDADKTVAHKAGYWYLNGLGDITNEQMRTIFIETNNLFEPADRYAGICQSLKSRVNLYRGASSKHLSRSVTDWNSMLYGSAMEAIYLLTDNSYGPKPTNLGALARGNRKVFIIYCIFNCVDTNNFGGIVDNAISLKYMWLKSLKKSVGLQSCSKFRNCCILYMIQNEAATSPITITLHADAYARAMANADIVAALEAHPNVSLALA